MEHLLIDILLAPVLGLMTASLILFVVGYANWHRATKERVTAWIESRIYGGSIGSKARAEALFGVVTSLLLTSGGLMIVVGIFILTHVEYN